MSRVKVAAVTLGSTQGWDNSWNEFTYRISNAGLYTKYEKFDVVPWEGYISPIIVNQRIALI
jgi:hypothetical protein